MIPDRLDSHTCAFYLEVPGARVALLQALFETYEGLATVRTLDIRRSLVCILTTTSIVDDCVGALEAIRPLIKWRETGKPVDADRYLGYFKKDDVR